MNSPGEATRDALRIWNHAVASVRGETLVKQAVAASDYSIRIADQKWELKPGSQICILAAGKAALSMAGGFVDSLTEPQKSRLPLLGQVHVPELLPEELPFKTRLQSCGITVREVRPRARNLPTPAAVEATRDARKMIESLSPDDLLVALISGGASALLVEPVAGVSLHEKTRVTQWLFDQGVEIQRVNTVRNALSAVKSGRLLNRCGTRRVATVLISDIVGDPIHLIGGGPTISSVPTQISPLEILNRAEAMPPAGTVEEAIPAAVWSALKDIDSEATKSRNARPAVCPHVSVLANHETLIREAMHAAHKLGYRVSRAPDRDGVWADDVGETMARWLSETDSEFKRECLIGGGETVVGLAPLESRGIGGRNQQLVLASYVTMQTRGLPKARDWALLSGGTDGQDGVTEAAGAWLDPRVAERIVAKGIDTAHALETNDANDVFRGAGGLLMTGDTGTNVCDLQIAIRLG